MRQLYLKANHRLSHDEYEIRYFICDIYVNECIRNETIFIRNETTLRL